MEIKDLRLIEAGFPCHQVGAETQRERGASSALPPLYFLHVWWARRPLTPSRAAILGSLLPADTDPDWFVKQLGIEKYVADINGELWSLVGKNLDFIQGNAHEGYFVQIDDKVLKAIEKEQQRRSECRRTIDTLIHSDSSLQFNPVIGRWSNETRPLQEPYRIGGILKVDLVPADPAHVNERISFAKSDEVIHVLGAPIKWDPEELYGYGRGYINNVDISLKGKTVLDPTAGGGSIPFEALRAGATVIANDLNPVASTIQHATLKYPYLYGKALTDVIDSWGKRMIVAVENRMEAYYHFADLPQAEISLLNQVCKSEPDIIKQFNVPEYDQMGLLYARQVTCPHCGGDAPLLNSCWLSKDGEKWGVRIVPDGKPKNGTVRFETYRILKGTKGPNGEDPNFQTCKDGTGLCIHCQQAIPSEEIKGQARGESANGKWQDILYCVVGIRYQPKLDKQGLPERFKSGERKGEIKTEKVRFFRSPVEEDFLALQRAEKALAANWDRWDDMGLIPTENFPEGNDNRPIIFGMTRWCDLFTPRQLLGHLTMIEELNNLKPQIIAELGEDKGRAVITYLQFAIDKGLDYNSRQTRWEYTRGVIKGTFGRHDFSLKWTYGEMIFTGPNSGAAWGLSQIVDSYKGISDLIEPARKDKQDKLPIKILNGSAANLDGVEGKSVDLICVDPPYYNNVQYAELSDFFYVWQKRTLKDQYPGFFDRRLTNKDDEAVANPARDGSASRSKEVYEKLMGEIFEECERVLKDDGLMTIMFTHKTQEAWEALTRSLIDTGWIITSSMPVDSESGASMHQKDMAAAASSIFISCRKKTIETTEPSSWYGFGNTGVAMKVREQVRKALETFAPLNLNPVDEMVASYGKALQVLSEHWPVMDGDELVTPMRAMNEASAVVAQSQISRLSQGRLRVDDIQPEAAMALTLFGIFGMSELPYDDALNLSRSLNITLEMKGGGYSLEGRMIGFNAVQTGKKIAAASVGGEAAAGYFAPLLRKTNKLRLAMPEERNPKRLENPTTEWDILQGIIMAYREGDTPVARAYLTKHAEGRKQLMLDLLAVWASEVPDKDLKHEANTILYGLK